MFCISLNPNHLDLIKNLTYLPVGLGDEYFSNEWYQDNKGLNISEKNKYYGEYTFHYWLWKNDQIELDDWIGFCQYRKFWKKPGVNINLKNFENFKNSLLYEIPQDFDNLDAILVEETFINQFRFSKFIKHNLKKMIKNPQLIYNKKKRNIKFHFDMMHGHGNLDKAIDLLPHSDKYDFMKFVNSEVSFNPHNMFICKNKNILFSYYESVLPWLKKCEEVFGFDKLHGYGLTRIYAFLAERYLSYWFKKYTKSTTLPIFFKDLKDFLK